MKTKFLFIVFLSTLYLNGISAQEIQSYNPNNEVLINDYIFSSEIGNQMKGIDYSQISGSPYENDEYIIGKVCNSSTGYSIAHLLRYNIYSDTMEIKVNETSNSYETLIKSDNIYASINQNEYYFKKYLDKNDLINTSYFIKKSEGKNSSLYFKKIKIFKDKQLPKNGFERVTPPTFSDAQDYYYQSEGEGMLLLFPNSNKKLLKIFSNKAKELKTFTKKEKINYKNEADVIKLFKYYDSLF